MSACKYLAGLSLLAVISLPAAAQDAEAGIAVPITITGDLLYTHRMQGDNPSAGPVAGGFHLALSPSLRLSAHWFAYASIQVRSTPFYYYDAFEDDHDIDIEAIQAFLGYTTTYKSATILVKAGQLATAFGAFPLHYDDADNPLLDQPLSYVTYVNVSPDQLCTAPQNSSSASAGYTCGGSYGLTPITLYGLPGIEIDISDHKLDGRFQVTNSSPANPHELLSGNQYAQWTAGGGYTVIQGLRIGASAFRGPYLDRGVTVWLAPGQSARDFPATGAGLDVQWARGRWSTSGEWQWFRFDYPGFRISPSTSIGYAEVKAALTPRIYAALRVGDQQNGQVAAVGQSSTSGFEANLQSYEFALGYRPNRRQLLKVGYEWLRGSEVPGTRDNVLGVELVTSIQPLSKAWR